jgi:CubicO group peptidase (beta-lactamase class C family)
LRAVIIGSFPPRGRGAARAARHQRRGGGYCVVQQLLVDATGTPFPRLLRELVLAPLGMARSTFENPLPEARWGQAATGHRAGGEVARGAHARERRLGIGSGSLPVPQPRRTSDFGLHL